MGLCDIDFVLALLRRHGFRFSKSLGQNFLIDASVPERIAEASGVDDGYGVLEIGPGVGCLTVELAKRAGRVAAAEVDARLIPVLRETVGGLSNVSVVHGDIMKLDLAELINNELSGLKPAVCANLPYNITSPVLTKLIMSGLFETITVMVQREVAMRIAAEPGTGDYGAFTLLCRMYTEPELLFEVPPSSFEPPPKVTSAVVRLTRLSRPREDVDEELFFRVVRAAFGQRRKTLLNALSSGFKELQKDRLQGLIEACGLSPTVRGETLSCADFAALTRGIGGAL